MVDLNNLAKRAEQLERDSFHNFFSILIDCSQIIKNIAPNRRRPWLAEVTQGLYRSQNGLLCHLLSADVLR